MSILNKPLDAVTIADLQTLIDMQARETDELEFKGALPFKPEKGSSATADRWIEKGDRIGNFAREKLLSEFIAFANSEGGTLVLGLHETHDQPRRADRLETLPNCEELARRIADAAEDCIEPRLPGGLKVKALPIDERGSGYVVFRVAKSAHGPHRSRDDREFYVRRGERSAAMTVKEIQHLTLEQARASDRLERIFEVRSAENFKFIADRSGVLASPFSIYACAMPTSPVQISNLTLNKHLWLNNYEGKISIAREPMERTLVANQFHASPFTILRGFRGGFGRGSDGGGLERLIRDDGLVELSLRHWGAKAERAQTSGFTRIYIQWILELAACLASQISHLRECLALDAIEYGVSVEIVCNNSVNVAFDKHDQFVYALNESLPPYPLAFPKYSLRSDEGSVNEFLTSLYMDICNVCGVSTNSTIELSRT